MKDSDSGSKAALPSATVAIESGLISGLQRPDNTRDFLGIPYAAPPVDDLRWRPPQRVQPWTGVRAATQFGASSLQFGPPAASLYSGGETDFSEDCLYLNVSTGPEEDGRGSGDRPVLVWFHMGAFQFGSASNPLYNGAKLVAQGVTVVTVNYRLGRLGFLAHPDLSAESPHGASGNYGIMDQIAALGWVQRNIKAFGGDPGNVTIGGASAGGCSVHILRSSPLAKSLFAKAISESGPGLAPTIEDGHGHLAGFTSLAVAEKAGTELLDLLGVSSIAELRKMPAQKIAAVHLPRIHGRWKSKLWSASTSMSIFDTSNAIVDGHVLPESPLTAFLSGRVADVPFLAGSVGNESSGLPYLASLADFQAHASENFGAHAEELLRVYPATTDAEVETSASNCLADQVFSWPMWTAARLQAKNLKSPVWFYNLLRAPPIPPDSDIIEKEYAGAFHGAGIPYAFGNLDIWQWDWSDSDRTLSEDMVNAWTRFVRTGNPNDCQEHAESWPALTSSDGLIKIFDSKSCLEKRGPHDSEVTAFWDKYYGVVGQVS